MSSGLSVYNTLMQPGDLISPQNGQNEEKPQPPAAPELQLPIPAQPATVQPQPVAEASPEIPTQQSEPAQNWAFQDEHSTDQQDEDYAGEISWTASEFISHQKDSSWYIGLGAATGISCVAIYLLTRDRITVVMVLVAAIMFGIFASRQPRVMNYRLDEEGLMIGNKHYGYNNFKSFAVQQEGAINSIFLLPLQRFMPGISIYYPPEEEQRILGTISNYLPHETRTPDVIDRLMRKVRF
jgi:hypothetical protein